MKHILMPIYQSHAHKGRRKTTRLKSLCKFFGMSHIDWHENMFHFLTPQPSFRISCETVYNWHEPLKLCFLCPFRQAKFLIGLQIITIF
jgi:hypothetical protein